MSYQVIARKWRPQGFDEVIGQDHVTTPLRNAIRSERVPHAILLCGPRGVGKTTLARILARCLNCEKGPTETPCGSCVPCQEITVGNSRDVQEIDAASRTSVDDVREVIESIRYAPSPGKHRIFVVDEVHMLSTAAFNALLKTLEEPPPHSLFVFATTNPEKIPFTVISRCQRYDLRRIGMADAVRNLAAIAESEGIRVSEASLRAIAREGEGSMRDAQTLLDQVISYGGSEISDETVALVLDLIDRRVLLDVAAACVAGDPAAALVACGRAAETGVEPKRLAGALIQLLRDLLVLRIAPEERSLVDASDDEVAELRELAEQTDAPRLRRMFRALVKEQEDLAWAPEPDAVLEVALVRIATLPAGDDVARLLSRVDALERRLSGEKPPRGGGGGAGGASGEASRARPSKEAGSSGGARSPRKKASDASSARDASAAPWAEASPRTGSPSAIPPPETPGRLTGSAETPGAGGAPEARLEVVFDRLRAIAQEENRGLYLHLEGGSLLEVKGDRIRLSARSPFHVQRLRDRGDALAALCARFFGRPMRPEIVDSIDPLQDAASDPTATREDSRRRKQAALNHPAVNIAVEELGAEIVEIRPLGARG